MSHYLVERIEGLANVEVVTGVRGFGARGRRTAQLEAIRWRDLGSGAETRRADPPASSRSSAPSPIPTGSRASGLKLDARGFVCTGADAGEDRLPLETSRRGVFAVGDVRAGSVKRVAAAVGDGAQVVASLHACFAEAPAEQPAARAVQTA